MTTTLEKVARAMYERPVDGLGIPLSYDGLDPHDRESLIADARAALMAIREPSEAARKEATIDGWLEVEGGYDDLWRKSIDAILAEVDGGA